MIALKISADGGVGGLRQFTGELHRKDAWMGIARLLAAREEFLACKAKLLRHGFDDCANGAGNGASSSWSTEDYITIPIQRGK